jgi:predicted Holliday junction resolvase-like endonuclease
MSDISNVFETISSILAVCPRCEGLFYLSEAHPYLAGKQPKSVVDRLRAEIRKLDLIDEELQELESELRRKAATQGLEAAKASLRKIDPIFSGAGHDPQDVKVIFHPITYVAFSGLSEGNVNKVLLLDHAATDAHTARLHGSLDRAIKRGNLEFKTLRVHDDGKVTSE